MSSQIESKLEGKLDKLVGEIHKTNNLLTELVVDNKHRDSRLDHLEQKDEKQDVINKMTSDSMLVNQPKIDKSAEFIEKYEKTCERQKARDERNQRISEHVLTKAVLIVALTLCVMAGFSNIPGLITSNVTQESKKD